MTEQKPTVKVEFVITTAKASYTVEQARLEIANLQAALKDIEGQQEIVRAHHETKSKRSRKKVADA